MALLWDERHGWALAMETHAGEDGRFMTAIRAVGGASTTLSHLKARLARYRRDIWAATAPRSHFVTSPVCS